MMMTMFQVVHGTAPAATGDGGESRGGRHTAPGAEQQRLDQAPNTGGTGDKSHFILQCPKQICQRCRGKGHHIKEGGVCWGDGRVWQ